MNWISWCITIVPLVFVLWIAIRSKKYIRDVADYLAVGRVAGRYVISIGDLQSGLGVITLVAIVEEQYQCGFALGFWGGLTVPIAMVVALTGYCIYRFRETRALSMGQFLELRYSRRFRIFAASLRTVSDIMTNALGPAVAARFFIYFLGLPHSLEILGFSIPTFLFVVALVLVLAMMIIWPGGRVALTVTDCIQAMMSYPIFVIFSVFVLCKFSFPAEIAPVMLDRAAGESFLNPFDVSQMRDFNVFALLVVIFGNIINRASWIGNDTSSCARTPHEQKMANIMGTWRNGFCWLMCMLIAITVITVLSHRNFAPEARRIRGSLVEKIAGEVVEDGEVRAAIVRKSAALPEQRHEIGVDRPLSRTENLDTPYLDTVRQSLQELEHGNAVFQKFRTLYYQMMMPMTMRELFSPVLMGLFSLLMIMLMLTTDDSRIFNVSSTIIQDVIMPFRKTPFTREQHFRCLRFCSIGVCVFFFLISGFLAQLDYINMFLTIMTSIWLGGAGPVMIFGLYSRFGTTAGAWASLFVGSGISIGGLVLQRNWADYVYPALEKFNLVDAIGRLLETVSGPFHPYVMWQMDAVKFPINSREIYFLAMIGGIAAYILFSFLTQKEPFNLDRMLHRGIYSDAGDEVAPEKAPWWSWRNFYRTFLGITPEYTRGDRIITWSVGIYSMLYQFGICFVGVIIWNSFSPLSNQWWTWYFYINSVVIATVIGVVSTVWFLAGGVIDLRRLFRDLKARKENELDDGWVEGNISAVDREQIGSIDRKGK